MKTWLPLIFGVLTGCCCATRREHIFGKAEKQEKVDLDLLWDDDVLEVVSHTPNNAPTNFRETTSRYVFQRHLVAIKDLQSNRCYVQKTGITRGGTESRLNAAKDTTDMELDNVVEEWINITKAVPVSRSLVKLRFGPEIAEFCRYEDVFFVDEGSSGILHKGPMEGRPGLQNGQRIDTIDRNSIFSTRHRRAPDDVIIILETDCCIVVMVIRE